MPVEQKGMGKNMGNTNGKLRKEIRNEIINRINNTNDVLRTADSIFLSDNFHLDARSIENGEFKVEIQYKKGTKQTVSVVTVTVGAGLGDLKTGLTNSLNDGHVYEVT